MPIIYVGEALLVTISQLFLWKYRNGKFIIWKYRKCHWYIPFLFSVFSITLIYRNGIFIVWKYRKCHWYTVSVVSSTLVQAIICADVYPSNSTISERKFMKIFTRCLDILTMKFAEFCYPPTSNDFAIHVERSPQILCDIVHYWNAVSVIYRL